MPQERRSQRGASPMSSRGARRPGHSVETPQRSVRVRSSSPVGLRVRGTWRFLRSKGKRPPPFLRGSAPLPWAPCGNRSQPTATLFSRFCRFRRGPICPRLPPVATARLHKRSILAGAIPDLSSGIRRRDVSRRLGFVGPPRRRVDERRRCAARNSPAPSWSSCRVRLAPLHERAAQLRSFISR
jgi:hypothetical protein